MKKLICAILTILIGVSSVITILPASSDSMFISDMTWVSSANFGTTQPYRDMNFENGGILKVGAGAYSSAKGIGMHPNAETVNAAFVTVDISALDFDTFTAVIGKDDATGASGDPNNEHVTFVVFLDGIELYRSAPMAYGMYDNVNVDIKGGSLLKLQVETYDRNSWGSSDWCDAKLCYSDSMYISDMNWIKATSHSSFPVVKDKNILNTPLKIAGVTYAKGFGLAAREAGEEDAELQVLIPEGYNYFEAIVGFDDLDHPFGTAEFKVLVDGVLVETTGIVLGGSGPHTISAYVTAGSILSLVTTNGGDTAAFDSVDWCNAALSNRTEPKVTISSPKGIIGSTNITVNGTWNYVDSVKIFAGGVEKGEATLSQNGTWTYALQNASTGQTTIEAKGFVDGVEATSNQITVTYVERLFISDMQWIEGTSHPTLPAKRGTNVYGSTLKLNGITYEKGFGVLSRPAGYSDATTSVTVPEGYNYFQATVGLDDIEAGGTVEFKILVNDVLVATTGLVQSGVHTISATVLPGSKLSLVTTNGGDTEARDGADWCNAVLYNKIDKTVIFDNFDKTAWGNGNSAGNKATLSFTTGRKYSLTLSVKVDKNLGRSTITIKDENQNIVDSKKIDCFFVTSSWVDVTFIVNSGGAYTLEITADGKNYTEIANVQFNEALGTATAGNAVVIDGVVISEEEL